MALLPEPFEFLELNDGESATYLINQAMQGEATIHPVDPKPRHVRIHMDQRGLTAPPPPGTPISVNVPVLRLYAKRLDKPSPGPYIDVSSKTLQADLLPRVFSQAALPITLKLTANGHRPQKRYSVEVL